MMNLILHQVIYKVFIYIQREKLLAIKNFNFQIFSFSFFYVSEEAVGKKSYKKAIIEQCFWNKTKEFFT